MRYRAVCLASVLILAPLCAGQATLVSPRGEETSLEIVTWNMEWFPREGEPTIQAVRQLIDDLEVDLYAVQEIADTAAFRSLLESLPGYDGLWSPDAYSWGDYQKTGVIWRTDQIAVSGVTSLYPGYEYAFPRPPIQVDVTACNNGHEFDFRLIVLHLKAGGGEENEARRRAAVEALKSYLDAERQTLEDPDFILAGDWNDELDDPSWDNVFLAFLDDSADYYFTTTPLAGEPYWASYPSTGALIDHLLIDQEVFDQYEDGRTETLRLDDEYSSYFALVSDHRPVMSVFPIFPDSQAGGEPDTTSGLPEERALGIPFPNPASGTVEGIFTLSSPGAATLNLYNCAGQIAHRLQSGRFSTGIHPYSLDATRLSSGIYFLILKTEDRRESAKLMILK